MYNIGHFFFYPKKKKKEWKIRFAYAINIYFYYIWRLIGTLKQMYNTPLYDHDAMQ